MSGATVSVAAERHSLLDDLQALLTGTLFIALGVTLFTHAGLLSGGTAGVAFLAHYATGWGFGAIFFTINLPFYLLAWHKLGRAFTFKTFAAVALLSGFTTVVPRWLSFAELNPVFAALAGGLMIGAGFLMLFRHHASLGGINILLLVLQKRWGWRIGVSQMAVDGLILLASLAMVSPERVGLSILGALAMNATLAINHRRGRYITF